MSHPINDQIMEDCLVEAYEELFQEFSKDPTTLISDDDLRDIFDVAIEQETILVRAEKIYKKRCNESPN